MMDDYSRFILAWKLKLNMAAGSLIDVVQKTVDFIGMTDVPVEDRTALLSDNIALKPVLRAVNLPVQCGFSLRV